MRFEVGAPIKPEVLACNCSICTMTGFLHLIMPASHFNEREAAMAAITQLR